MQSYWRQVSGMWIGTQRPVGREPVPGVRVNDSVGRQTVVALEAKHGSPRVFAVDTTWLDAQRALYVLDGTTPTAQPQLVGVTHQPDEVSAHVVRVHRLT